MKQPTHEAANTTNEAANTANEAANTAHEAANTAKQKRRLRMSPMQRPHDAQHEPAPPRNEGGGQLRPH